MSASLVGMARRQRTHKRRGGGILNRVKGFFTRKSSKVAPVPVPVSAPVPVRQPTKKSKWSLSTLKNMFRRKKPSTENKFLLNEYNPYVSNTTIPAERFDDAVERMMWYLYKRREGTTHKSLLPFLTTSPGKMRLSREQFNELAQVLLIPNNTNTIHETVFGLSNLSNFDDEINEWEHGRPANPLDRRRLCSKQGDTCILYEGTPYERHAHGNIAQSLSRFINNLRKSSNFKQFRVNKDIGIRGCPLDERFYTYTTFEAYMNPIQEFSYTMVLKSDVDKEPATGYCLHRILKLNYLLTCFRESFTPGTQNIIYFTSVPMGLWLQDNHPALFAAAFGTASGWGNEDQTTKPYTWKLQSPLERIRMLTLQHWFAKKAYVDTDGDGDAARQFFVSYPEPVLSEVLRLQEDNSAEFDRLSAEFKQNQMELRYENTNTGSNSVLSLEQYLRFLENRAQLTTRPPTLPPINLSQAVPYNATTALSDVKRTNYFKRKFRDPQMLASQKAQARNLLSLAQTLEQQGNVYMREEELARMNSLFTVQPRPNYTRRLRR